MNVNEQIVFYNDLMLIEAFMHDKNRDYFIKNAFSFSTFFDEVKNYFSNKIDPNDAIGSVVNFMAPGLIFRSLGMGKLGFLLGTVTSLMGIDVSGIMKKAWNIVYPKVQSGKVTNSDVDNAIHSVVTSQNTTLTESQENNLLENNALSTLFSGASLNFDDITILSSLSVVAANSIKNGDSYKNTKHLLDKVVVGFGRRHSGVKGKLILFVGKIIGFIFKAALAALGFNLIGDVAKKMTGFDNAIDGPNYVGAPKQKQQHSSIKISKQTLFPKNDSYSEKLYNGNNSNWIINVPNTTSSIKNLLIKMTKEVYNGLDGLESKITSSNDFNKVLYDIEDYNISAAGDNFVFIPKKYKSKKQLVDHFIDDVARISGNDNELIVT